MNSSNFFDSVKRPRKLISCTMKYENNTAVYMVYLESLATTCLKTYVENTIPA